MRTRIMSSAILVAALAGTGATVRGATPATAGERQAQGPSPTDTRLLNQPTISREHIAFIYAGDLWVARLDGSGVRRLTSHLGVESNPAFSPDGKLVAFSGHYDGNTDVYVVPVEGGAPRRLTWHPGPDLVQGFTPDGASVLFTSGRAVFTNRYSQLFTVPVGGGVEQLLPIPHAASGALSPDGRFIAYTPLAPRHLQWKRYRGGTVSRVFIYDVASHAIEKVPQPPGRANDLNPAWIADTLYFCSDRGGEFNLYSFERRSKTVRQLTRHADFPVISAATGAGKIAYEQAGYLHLFDTKTGESSRLHIGVGADLIETRPRFVKGAKYARSASLSPTGARAVLDFRGEILTIPAEKGDARNLTNTPGAHERWPVWSPDGKKIAYFSDETGEYDLVVRDQMGKERPRRYRLSGAGFYDRPAWSPDSHKLAFTDNSFSVYFIDLDSAEVRKVAQERLYAPRKTLRPTWSPDSRWIAYTLHTLAYIQTVYVYSIAQNRSYAITDGMSEVSEPVFDRSGKYLYFLASTDAGPVKNWFSLENEGVRVTSNIYVAVLRKELPSPLTKESDEEKGPKPERAGKEAATASDKPDKEDEPPKMPAASGPVNIDFDGLEYRIVALPIAAGEYSALEVGAPGQVYYLRLADGKRSLVRFDFKDRKSETLVPEAEEYELSFDTKKMLIRQREPQTSAEREAQEPPQFTWSILPAAKRPEKSDKVDKEKSDGKLKIDAIQVRIDPRAEWRQIFDEAWRINRDYFYDPHMHGVDWKAMHRKYAAFLPDLAARADLTRVLQWMFSELAVGHHRVGGGDTLADPPKVPGGLLGADYAIEHGHYRFRKVYGGLNWNPELRAPLTEPGVNVKAGDYLLAVGGQQLRSPTNVYALFENTAGKLTDITVGPSPDGAHARTVQVVPIANEDALRNRDWVESNLRKVNAATSGRVAYVYVPNTAALGYTYFKRYFFPQSYKDAVIVDERFNGGGSVADYYIDVLRRPLIAYWAMRYGADMKTPSASIQGPKAMLIDETAGSGGDLLPWMFHKFQLGPLIGQRTWGGLVGILGFPVLMDGGTVTAPNLAIWTPENGWVVENEGVPPDIEVEQTPADIIAGRDPQLEKAIELVMQELKKHPPAKPKRPSYPNKTVSDSRAAR